MKIFFCCILILFNISLYSQQLQLHYEIRNSIDPELNPKNFLSLCFDYYKSNKNKGSFLIRMQTDFTGENQNPGQVYLQITKQFRYWKPKISLAIGYGGGFGVAPPSYGYYIANTYSIGIARPFKIKTLMLNIDGGYKYSAFTKKSHDAQLNIFFWKRILKNKANVSGSISTWTQNRNIGDDYTNKLEGKKFAFCADPQLWIKIWKKWSAGTKVSCFYHVLTNNDIMQFYPTAGIKHEF